jgi:uncharacterized protein DUF4198
MTATRGARRIGATITLTLVATLGSVGILLAHDFWVVPNALAFAAGAQIELLGQSGTKFPASDMPTQPAQVAEARLVGASSDERITDLSVSGKSLLIRHKPTASGQLIVALSLAPRTGKTTPDRLKRYIAGEGAPELAARYESEGAFPKMDSVTQVSAKYAKSIVQVGSAGPRAFDKVIGHALEIVPLCDPAALRVNDTLRVRLLYHGRAVGNVHLRAGSAPHSAVNADAAAGAPAPRPGQTILTGADGVAKLVITESGLWNVRVLYSAPMAGMPEHWEAFFATIVFSVGDK